MTRGAAGARGAAHVAAGVVVRDHLATVVARDAIAEQLAKVVAEHAPIVAGPP
jgi:hypothetical protein